MTATGPEPRPPHTPRTPWVGDQIRDEATGRDGYVTDVQQGTYVLRPLYGGPHGCWTTDEPGRLTVTVPRELRAAEGWM